MGFPIFRVTLNNDIEGALVISEPGGWDDAKLLLQRNQDYHSLVEFYDQPLTFYGEDNTNNGGIDYIRNIEQTQGIDAQITILIEISNDDGATYETVVENTLEIESVKETDFYKMDLGVIRNGFWQNFMNRKDTPVNLLSTTDLDGQIRDAINAITIQLPSQKIRQSIIAENKEVNGADDAIANGAYLQVDFDNVTLEEIKEKFNLPLAENATIPVPLIELKYAGTYNFEIELYCYDFTTIGSLYQSAKTGIAGDFVDFYIQFNDEAPIIFSWTDIVYPSPGEAITKFTYSGSKTFDGAGGAVRIFGQMNQAYVGGGVAFLIWNSIEVGVVGAGYVSNITITGDTLYEDSEAEGFFIHEAGNAITDRIICRDGTFYSEYLGNTLTQIQSYAEDGCGSKYALTRGLNIRGYSLADKPFFMSFDTWWNGINPILNLGLGYERLGSPELEVIRVEQKSYFYNPITSINFDFVNNIERSYDFNYVFKLIEIGYEKWSAESASGIDDPQTKRIYNTRFKTVGKEVRILSKYIAASLALEQTRRNRVEQGKDWKFDEEVFIIAMNLTGSPEFLPELDENFTSVTNLLNSDTRYNIRLSVARNFERWKDYFNGCLQWYLTDDYKFASGEGNFDMTSTLDGSDCEYADSSPATVDEKGDIPITDDFLFMPIVYTFEHPLTWDEYKTIRDNRNNAIGISRTDANHIACFIQELEYEITHGKAKFTVILGEHAYL